MLNQRQGRTNFREDVSLKAAWRGFLDTVRQASGTTSSTERVRRLPVMNKSASQTAVVRKHRPDYKIVMFMALLMLVGLVLIYAIGPRVNINNQTAFFVKQLISMALAIAGFVIVSKIPLTTIRRLALPILVIGLGAGLLLLILSTGPFYKLGLAQCANGACRWFKIGGLGTIQVAEIIKLSLIVFLATLWKYFADRGQINSSHNIVYSVLIISLALLMVVGWQNDLGTGIALIAIAAAMLWAAGIKRTLVMSLAIVLVIGGALAVAIKPHRVARVMTFLQGDSAAITDANRHIIQAKIAVGSGGMFGLGIGNSIQATGYLPEAVNDSIFAIIGEMFGLVGCLAIIALFVGLIGRLYRGAALSHDMFNRLLMTGAATWVLAHFLINTTSMLGIAPMTGITLPFLSFGGTSIVFVAVAIGLAFNASRFTAHSLYLDKGK